MMQNRESVNEIIEQLDAFFMQKGPVYHTLHELARRLSAEEIAYALVGGMALALHGFVRPTQDVDLLLSREGLEQFHERLVGRGYTLAFPGARKSFRDAQTGVRIEVLTSGEYPGDGKAKAIAFPNPYESSVTFDDIRVVSLEKLIELKLASGLSAEHRRLRDLADVQQLIETLCLPLELAARLDASVQTEYRRLWQLAQVAIADEEEKGKSGVFEK